MSKPVISIVRGGMVLDSTMDHPRKASLLIENGIISDVVDPQMPTPPHAKQVDATGHLLIPGLVNAHTHSHFSIGKGVNPGWNLEMHQHSSPGITGGQSIQDLNLLSTLSAAEMISKGCTSCYDMVLELPHPSPEGVEQIAAGYERAGLRARIALTIADRTFWHAVPGLAEALPGEARALVDAIRLTSTKDVLAACRDAVSSMVQDSGRGASDSPGSRRVSLALAPTIPMLCSDELLLGAKAFSEEFNLGLHTHLAESRLQFVAGPKCYGRSLTEHLDHIGYLGSNLTAAHAVWVSEADMTLLAKHDVKIAHNPSSNLRLGNGVAELRRMLDAGLKVGIGTDACTCSDQLNMFEAMRQACLVSRLKSDDSEHWIDANTAFTLATANGEHIMDRKLGLLQPGYDADIVFLELDHLNYVPLNNALRQVVFNENGAAVNSVMIGGDIVYWQREFTRFDYKDLVKRVHEMNAERIARLAPRSDAFKAFEKVVSAYCLQLARS